MSVELVAVLAKRAARFRHERRPDLEDMRHLPPDLQIDFDAGGARSLGEARRIVEQDFGVADLNQKRRQAREIGE
ncbi:hypothetical protein [Candidatus Burkholderia verschuerenii]|uniref:hypothetical protein n=1 Tax=Candidatus Burkholderia verschuerenii TaxID=242163 RepID=UPI002FC36668